MMCSGTRGSLLLVSIAAILVAGCAAGSSDDGSSDDGLSATGGNGGADAAGLNGEPWQPQQDASTLPPITLGDASTDRDTGLRPVEQPDGAVDQDAATLPPSGLTTFRQGLYRGEDPRIRQVNGRYYWVANEGRSRKLFRSDSLVDRGGGKLVPPQGGAHFPLFAPVYIGTLNGQQYDAWFAFDTNVWRCDCQDPYENADQWQVVKSIPLTGWSIDFEIFTVPEPSPYAGRSYLTWAGADSPSTGWGFESCFIAELLDLRPGQPTLSTLDNGDANRIATYAFDWTDVVAEAPAPAIHDGTVSIVYSGNGAHTVEYALGLVILRQGADPAGSASWIDYNRGGCDGDVKSGAEMGRTAQVFGPGVARFVPSPDGMEDWMVYHAKTFETFNRGTGTPGQQDNNMMWSRYFNLKEIGWRDVSCAGQTYAIPDLGTPPDPGAELALPSGDPGVTPGARRVEAETMIPFGFVMGPTMQAVPRVDADPEVILARSGAASNGEKVTHLDALAADVADPPKRGGILWRNSVAASGVAIASASVGAASLDLYVNGTLATTVTLPATGSPDAFQVTQVSVTIPAGAEVQLVYEVGKSTAADIDYVDLMP